jgi:hypothetical protein
MNLGISALFPSCRIGIQSTFWSGNAEIPLTMGALPLQASLLGFCPLFDRLEIRQRGNLFFSPGFKFTVEQGKVDRKTKRLRHMPMGIDEKLEAVAFRVAKIDRPSGAVGNCINPP